MLLLKNGLMLEADENFPLDFRWGNSCRSWFVYSLCNSNVEDILMDIFYWICEVYDYEKRKCKKRAWK